MATKTVYEQLDYDSKCALHTLKCTLDSMYANYVTAGQKTNKNAVISALTEIEQVSKGIAEHARLLAEKLEDGTGDPTPKAKGKGKAAPPKDESFEDKIRRMVAEEVKKHLKIDGCYYDGGGSVTLLWDKKEFASDSL